MKVYKAVPIVLGALVVIGATPLRNVSLYADLWTSFALHFGLCLVLFYKLPLKPERTVLLYLIGPLVLFSIDFFYWEGSFSEQIRSTIWPNVLPDFIAPLCAYLFYNSEGWRRIAISGISIALYLSNIFWLSNKWNTFKNYGVFSQEVSQQVPVGWVGYATNGQKLTAEDFTHKLVLLDFWNSGCPACIRSFPSLDSFYHATSSSDELLVQSIFVPLSDRDTPGIQDAILSKRKASFPVVWGKGLDTAFSIMSYPTVLVVYRNRIVFKGKLGGAIQKIRELQESVTTSDNAALYKGFL